MEDLRQQIIACLAPEGDYAGGQGYIDIHREQIDEIVDDLLALMQRREAHPWLIGTPVPGAVHVQPSGMVTIPLDVRPATEEEVALLPKPCAVEQCENAVAPRSWVQWDFYCERPLPRGESKAYESIIFRLQLCDRHYRLLYIQPSHFPDAVSISG